MNERWAVIPEFPDYEVSDHGRVRRITNYGRGKAGRIRRTRKVEGYPGLNLTHRDGRRKGVRVHRLVAEAFIPNPEGLREVNHKDGTRSNNHYSNLEWVSSSGNRLHAYVMGGLCAEGEGNGRAKLTTVDALKIRSVDTPARVVAQTYGVSPATIRDIRARRSWAHLD